MAGIRLKDIHKTYQVDGRTFPVLNGVDLEIPEGKITVILGQSGCGKTTLLRLTGGLESADSGEVLWDAPTRPPLCSRNAAHAMAQCLEQYYFRFEEKSVDQEKIQDIVSTVNLSGFEKAYPSQLSGGMQQRAAIARALAYEPTFILMDEPFAALDYFTREQMQRELLRVQQKEHSSIMFVTHSIDEALILGDQIVMIEKGLVKHVYPVKTPSGERNLLNEEFIALKRDIIENLNFIN